MFGNNDFDTAVKRIKKMESCFDKAQAAAEELRKALNVYSDVQKDIEILSEYYGSSEWKSDLMADEAGKLPAGLKRGVLSEDGIWNFLDDNRDLAEDMRKLADKILKEKK